VRPVQACFGGSESVEEGRRRAEMADSECVFLSKR
jgi:hypothetical protein